LIEEFATIAWKHHHLPSPPLYLAPLSLLVLKSNKANPKEKRKKQRKTNVNSAWVTTSRADQIFKPTYF
jgi:hypothetical protein